MGLRHHESKGTSEPWKGTPNLIVVFERSRRPETDDQRPKDASRMAFGTLSFSCAETLRHVMAQLLDRGPWKGPGLLGRPPTPLGTGD